MEYKDYYALLGVERKATADEIKHAYRRLARKYHPDVSKEKNAEEKFKDIQEAYEVLKDSEKRQAYDQLGSNWKSGQEFRPPPGWQGGNFHAGGGHFSQEDLGGFSEFFANLFGGGGGGRTQNHFRSSDFGGFHQRQDDRGTDQHAKITISLSEAFHGATKKLQLEVPEMDHHGRVQLKPHTLKVTIPKGSQSGQQLRLANQGTKKHLGGKAGDLYLEINIAPDPLYTLEGRDVYLTVPVTPWEAALGGEIKIPTLAGTVELKLAPNSKSGQKLRLKGRGLPAKPTPGDQYIILKIEIPPATTAEQRDYYSKMQQMFNFSPRKDWPV